MHRLSGPDLAQVRARSEDDADDELLAVTVVKSGSKVVTGSQMGVLNLYSWGYFNDCSDRFPGAQPLQCLPLIIAPNCFDSSLGHCTAFVFLPGQKVLTAVAGETSISS